MMLENVPQMYTSGVLGQMGVLDSRQVCTYPYVGIEIEENEL